MSTNEDKARENRLRRMAARQGLTLAKSRRRDPRALDYGTYCLFRCEIHGPECTVRAGDVRDGHWRSHDLVAGDTNTGYGLDLDEVEKYLDRDRGAQSVHSATGSDDAGSEAMP